MPSSDCCCCRVVYIGLDLVALGFYSVVSGKKNVSHLIYRKEYNTGTGLCLFDFAFSVHLDFKS